MLIEFRVKNFLSIKDLTVSFKEDVNFFAIFGANSSGKTNFLKAIDHAFNIFNRQDRETTLAGKEPNADLYNIKKDNTFRYGDSSEIAFGLKCKISNKIYDYEYKYSAESNTIIAEKLTVDDAIYLEDFKIINEGIKKSLLEKGISASHIEATRNPEKLLLQHLLNNNIVEYSIEIKNFYNYIHFVSSNNIGDLYSRIYSRIDNNSILLQDLFCAILKGIEKIGKEKKIKEYLNILDPTLIDYAIEEGLDLARKRNLYKISFRSEEGKFFAFNEISTGTINILLKYMELILIIDSLKKHSYEFKALVLVDEIEQNINPHILERYIDMVFESKDLQIISTTHSTDMLDYLTKENILIADRDENNKSTRIKNILELDIKDEQLRDAYINGLLSGIPDIAK
jgi:predicted ATP-dependent endonuclease of OLD family